MSHMSNKDTTVDDKSNNNNNSSNSTNNNSYESKQDKESIEDNKTSNNNSNMELDLEGDKFDIFSDNKCLIDENKLDNETKILEGNELKNVTQLIWGKNGKKKDLEKWYSQGFGFVPLDSMSFGLLQLHGGPSGIIAVVQGFLLCELLFDNELGVFKEDNSIIPLKPSNEQRDAALFRALTFVIYKCSSDRNKLVWVADVNNDKTKFYYKVCKNKEILYEMICASKRLLGSNSGIVCFLISCILSRGVYCIKGEINNNEQPLVLPESGHCSQALVNLMITGTAVTNTDDSDKVLSDSTDNVYVLKGIPPNQQIGFLSTLEVMKFSKVGENYKTPNFPVWVIGSITHYSTIFSLNINVGKIRKSKEVQNIKLKFKKFDLLENNENDPKSWTMYHFNGLRQTKKDVPTLTRIRVQDEININGNLGNFNDFTGVEELTGLLRTIWPECIVNMDSPFAPKIN